MGVPMATLVTHWVLEYRAGGYKDTIITALLLFSELKHVHKLNTIRLRRFTMVARRIQSPYFNTVFP